MQVSVEKISELSRKMTVEVPEEKIQEQVSRRLKTMAGRVKLDGFRPGKAPHSLIHKKYGPGVREEVLAELIQSSFNDAIQKENLKPVSGPMITPQDTPEGQGLKYIADFEVMPEFVLFPIEEMEVERFVSEVTEENVDAMLLRLREQRKIWVETDQPAANGDRLTINYEGRLNEENFTDGKVENFDVILGSNRMIPGFEERLVGVVAGSRPAFDLAFPLDYSQEKLAGKAADFSIEVLKVEHGVLPNLDQEFLASFGIENGDMDAFRSEIRSSMEREMRRALASRSKDSVMDELYRRNATLSLPSAMVSEELKALIKAQNAELGALGLSMSEAKAAERLEHVARRRVALGLLLNRIIEANQIKLDSKRVRSMIEELALSYEKPEEVVNWYYSNRNQLAQVQNVVMEDQVVDLILERSKVSEHAIGFDELMHNNPNTTQA